MSERSRRVFLGAAAALLAGAGVARAAPSDAEARKIESLIRFVEARKDLRFVRNGSGHTAAQAGRFLRGKLDSMGKSASTAREFIDQIATRSSTSGQPYTVETEGRSIPAAQFLGDELARIERGS
ncbi:MAG: DUF5329 family protein [Burkholderiaceae bacterium]